MISSADWTAHQLAVTQLQDTAHASLAWFRTDDTGPDPLRAYIPGDTEPAPAELRSLVEQATGRLFTAGVAVNHARLRSALRRWAARQEIA